MKGETRKERDEEGRKEGRKNKKEGKKEEKERGERPVEVDFLGSFGIYVERVVRAYLYRRVDQ